MCMGGPSVPEAKPPIDANAEAAQAGYSRARQRRAAAMDESDTDVVGSVLAGAKKPQVSTQLKSLMGA